MIRRFLIGASLPGLALLLLAALVSPVAARKYAVIITGYGDPSPHVNNMKFMYTTLRNKYAFDKKDIFVLWNYGQFLDLDGDGNSECYDSCTTRTIAAVFDTLDLNRGVNQNDLVFVYCDDHGAVHSQLCTYLGGQNLWASTMENELSNLNDGDLSNYWPRTFALFDQCYSGGFVDSLLPYYNRAACSAAQGDEESYAWTNDASKGSNGYDSFSYYWISAMNGSDPHGGAANADANGDGYVSYKEAFDYAINHDEYHAQGSSTPEYWDYWDGFGRTRTLGDVEIPMSRAIAWRNPHHLIGPLRTWGNDGTSDEDEMPGHWGSGFQLLPVSAPAPAGPAAAAPAGNSDVHSGMAFLRVHNTGNQPATGAVVHFYYGVPSTIASASDTSLHAFATVPLGILAPGDSALAGPVTLPTLGLNPFGQNHWKLFATVASPSSPLESGWVFDDPHTAIENFYRDSSSAGAPADLYYRVVNPETGARRIYLRLAENTLPAGWSLQSTPALNETIAVAPHATLTARLRVIPDGVHGPAGTVAVEADLLTSSYSGCWVHCLGVQESTFVSEGGYLRTTGGIRYQVAAPYTVSVPEEPPEVRVSLAYPNPSSGRVTLAYTLPAPAPVRVLIYDVTGRCLLRRELGAQGEGTHAFVWDGRDGRGRAAPGGTYLLRLQFSGRTESRRIALVR